MVIRVHLSNHLELMSYLLRKQKNSDSNRLDSTSKGARLREVPVSGRSGSQRFECHYLLHIQKKLLSNRKALKATKSVVLTRFSHYYSVRTNESILYIVKS